jgi:hypothetical protein
MDNDALRVLIRTKLADSLLPQNTSSGSFAPPATDIDVMRALSRSSIDST